MNEKQFVDYLTEVASQTVSKDAATAHYKNIHEHGCFLCRKKPIHGIECFFPNEPTKFGGAANRGRMLWYGLCEEHGMDEACRERIEEALWRDFNVKPIGK